MIKRMTISNFKSLVGLALDFAPLTVLIGRSGTGKSNIVQGIRFWRDFLAHGNFNHVQPTEWPKVLSATSPHERFSFQAEIELPRSAGIYVYQISYEAENPAGVPRRLSHEALFHQSRTIFRQGDGRWLNEPEMLQVPAPGEPALGRLYGIPEASLVYLALTKGIGCYDFPGDVLAPAPPRNAGGKAVGPGLDDHATNHVSALESISGDVSSSSGLPEIVAALKTLNPAVNSLEVDTRGLPRVLVGHRVKAGKTVTFELSQQSEGFRRFLAHLLALYQVPRRPLLIFEEPERGIYPRALATLSDYFTAAAASGETQIILTTHSPELLDHFMPESIRVVEMDDYATRVGPVSSEQLEGVRESLITPGELLTVDEARTEESIAGA